MLALINELSSRRATGWRITLEPEPQSFDQVGETAARHATVDVSVGSKGTVESSSHCSTARGELRLHSEDFDLYEDMPCLLPPSSSVCPLMTTEVKIELSVYVELSVCLELSACPEPSIGPEPTTEFITLYVILPVLGIAIWFVWAAHTFPENRNVHKIPHTSFSHPCFSSATVASCQPLSSPSALYLCGGITVGLPVTICTLAG